MQLISDIVDLAIDNQQPVGVLLRKGLVLAHRLNNTRLKSWAEKELNGYKYEDDLPPYRRASAGAVGHFNGPFGAAMKNVPIPSAVLEREHREVAENVRLVQPIVAYEELVKSDQNPIIPWPPNLVLYYQDKLMDGFGLISAWQKIPRSIIVSAVEAVRNRLLQFALKIQEELGILQTDDVQAIPAEKVDRSVVHHIYGGNNVFTGTAHTVTQNNMTVTQNDLVGLSRALQLAGIPAAAIEELRRAIENDTGDRDPPRVGDKVKGWLTGIRKFFGPAAMDVVTKAIEAYYGLS